MNLEEEEELPLSSSCLPPWASSFVEVSPCFPGLLSTEPSLTHWWLKLLFHSDLGDLMGLVLFQVLMASSSSRQVSRLQAPVSASFISREPASRPRTSKLVALAPLVVLSFQFVPDPELIILF